MIEKGKLSKRIYYEEYNCPRLDESDRWAPKDFSTPLRTCPYVIIMIISRVIIPNTTTDKLDVFRHFNSTIVLKFVSLLSPSSSDTFASDEPNEAQKTELENKNTHEEASDILKSKQNVSRSVLPLLVYLSSFIYNNTILGNISIIRCLGSKRVRMAAFRQLVTPMSRS